MQRLADESKREEFVTSVLHDKEEEEEEEEHWGNFVVLELFHHETWIFSDDRSE